MNSKVIFLKEALRIVTLKDESNKPIPFDIKFRTFNSQTKKGGKLHHYSGVKHLPDANPNAEKSKHPSEIFARETYSRNPSHYKNRTRNIELLNGEIKKIHIDFIIEINGKKVIN